MLLEGCRGLTPLASRTDRASVGVPWLDRASVGVPWLVKFTSDIGPWFTSDNGPSFIFRVNEGRGLVVYPPLHPFTPFAVVVFTLVKTSVTSGATLRWVGVRNAAR